MQPYAVVLAFILFEQNGVQFTLLFLFHKAVKISKTSSIVKKSTAAAMQKDMAVSERLK